AWAERAPAQMLRDERRLDAIDQPLELCKMPLAQAIRRAERQGYAMQADRIIGARLLQYMQIVAPLAEIVFAVHLHPVNVGTRIEKLAVMEGAQADAHPAQCVLAA